LQDADGDVAGRVPEPTPPGPLRVLARARAGQPAGRSAGGRIRKLRPVPPRVPRPAARQPPRLPPPRRRRAPAAPLLRHQPGAPEPALEIRSIAGSVKAEDRLDHQAVRSLGEPLADAEIDLPPLPPIDVDDLVEVVLLGAGGEPAPDRAEVRVVLEPQREKVLEHVQRGGGGLERRSAA